MIRQHIFRTILFAIIGLAIGFAYLQLAPKVYEGRTQLVIGTQYQNNMRMSSSIMSEEVSSILQSGLATNPITEAAIIRGEGVFRQAVEDVATKTGNTAIRMQADDLYLMYDVVSSPDSSDVLVRARAYSPEIATELANAVAMAYNNRRQMTQREAVAKAMTYLQGQIDLESGFLKESETKYKEKKEELGLPEIGANVTRDIEYQAQLRANIDSANAELAAAEKSIAELNAEIARRPEFETADQYDQKRGSLVSLESQLAELERQKQAALVQYYEDAESVKFLNASIASVKKQMAEITKSGGMDTMTKSTRPDGLRRTLESQLSITRVNRDATRQRVAELQRTYDLHTAKVNQLPASFQVLTELARDVSLKEANYRRLMMQYEDLKNRTEATADAAGIVYPAIQDTEPVLPRPVLVYVVSVLGGAILGLLISFAIEAMRLRIYSSSQLQELTGLPVAGVVHDLPGPTARKLLTSVREANPMVSESYRFMAFSAMSKNGGQKKILLTGIDDNAGCSTTAAQFATALAQAGSRVMLADCALEDPTITKVFGLEQSSGVSDILSQTQLPQPDSIPGSDTEVPNLRVLGAGTEGRSAIKVAASQNINGMIGALSSHCDVLVIDSMPCLASSDAARLVPYVDEVYLVVNAKTANMRNVAAAIDVLTLASAASVKFVFTKGSRGEEAVMKQANLASVRV